MRCIRFADELAHAAGKDPLEYLWQLLGPDRIIPKSELPKDYSNYDGDYAQYPIDTARFRRVLSLAAEKAGWGKQKSGNGFGMGIAMHRSFLTYVATVVQVHVDDAGHVQIDRVDTGAGCRNGGESGDGAATVRRRGRDGHGPRILRRDHRAQWRD